MARVGAQTLCFSLCGGGGGLFNFSNKDTWDGMMCKLQFNSRPAVLDHNIKWVR